VFTTLQHKVFKIINNSWCDIVFILSRTKLISILSSIYCIKLFMFSFILYKRANNICGGGSRIWLFTGGGRVFVNGRRGSVDGWCLGYLFLGFGTIILWKVSKSVHRLNRRKKKKIQRLEHKKHYVRGRKWGGGRGAPGALPLDLLD